MKRKKMCILGLILFTLIGNTAFVTAAEAEDVRNDSLQEVVSDLETGYSEYYNILNTEVMLCSNQEVDGKIEKIYQLDMEVVLKAENVEQLDYYQGITSYCNATAKINKASTETSRARMNLIASEKNDIYEQLKEYIGLEQNLIFFVKETYPIDNEEEKEILFENGLDYVSLEEMLPKQREELKASGYARMQKYDTEYAVRAADVTERRRRASYSVDAAVDYMTTYTSNPSSCNVCGSGCSSKVDTTKYNPDYGHYVSKGSHVDCANYVSQALHAGGIATDTTWKAGSSAWINVAKLTNYMTENSHWSSVSYSEVEKGDIVSYTAYSHVVMITSFDGTTYKYSGHTNDRLNATISIKSSTSSKYNFYRVS